MAFVLRIVLESGHAEHRVFGKLADAMRSFQGVREAFERDRAIRRPNGEAESISDYALIQVTSADARGAVDQVGRGEGFIVHNLERDERRHEETRQKIADTIDRVLGISDKPNSN